MQNYTTGRRHQAHVRDGIDNRRKFKTQMSADEMNFLYAAVDSREFKVGFHSTQRMAEKGITEADVYSALNSDYTVIEVNNNRDNDFRVLIKGKAVSGRELHVVVSLIDNTVKTTYWVSSHGYTGIDMTIYSWKVDVREVLKNKRLLNHAAQGVK